jgi:hypothetical protein
MDDQNSIRSQEGPEVRGLLSQSDALVLVTNANAAIRLSGDVLDSAWYTELRSAWGPLYAKLYQRALLDARLPDEHTRWLRDLTEGRVTLSDAIAIKKLMQELSVALGRTMSPV